MNIKKIACIVMASIALTGCSTWSTSHVTNTPDNTVAAKKRPSTSVDKIVVTDAAIKDKKYVVLGDISATVRKTTIFNSNPTKDQVNQKLKEQAAELGADAVIMVRYGDLGASLVSWASLNGKGRAIAYVD